LLGAGDEVVEDALFLQEAPGVVPGPAALAPAGQIGVSADATVVEPEAQARIEPGRPADAVTAVTGQQDGAGQRVEHGACVPVLGLGPRKDLGAPRVLQPPVRVYDGAP
jgi:hypothetical protein